MLNSTKCEIGRCVADFDLASSPRKVHMDFVRAASSSAIALVPWCFATVTSTLLEDAALVTARLQTAYGSAVPKAPYAHSMFWKAVWAVRLSYSLAGVQVLQKPERVVCGAEIVHCLRIGGPSMHDETILKSPSCLNSNDTAVGNLVLRLNLASVLVVGWLRAGQNRNVGVVLAYTGIAALLFCWVEGAEAALNRVKVAGGGWGVYGPDPAAAKPKQLEVRQELVTSNAYSDVLWPLISGWRALAVESQQERLNGWTAPAIG